MLTEADALYGAAWQVLFERLDPDGCVNIEKDKKMTVQSEVITAWATTQSPEVQAAYRRALANIMSRGKKVLENNIRAAQQRAARASIPVPPEA